MHRGLRGAGAGRDAVLAWRGEGFAGWAGLHHFLGIVLQIQILNIFDLSPCLSFVTGPTFTHHAISIDGWRFSSFNGQIGQPITVVLPERKLLKLLQRHPAPLQNLKAPAEKHHQILVGERGQMVLVELLLLHQLQQYLLVLVLPRSHPEQHLVAKHSQRKEISFRRVVRPLQCFRRHISGGPDVYLTRQAFFADDGKAEIAYFPIGAGLEDVGRLEVSMENLILHEVAIGGENLLHDAEGGAFGEFLMLFDEGVEGAVRTVLQHEVEEVGLFDDLEALDDVGVVQLPVHLHLLPQQLQAVLVLPHLAPVHHLDRVLRAGVLQTAAQVDLAGVALPNQILLLVLVLLDADLSLGMCGDWRLGRLRGEVFEQVVGVGGLHSLLPVVILGIVHVTDKL